MAPKILNKVKTLTELSGICAELRKQKKKVVHCHGVFDLMHLGHIRHLNSGKAFGDILVVTLTGDKFVKRGPGRPIFNQDLRAEALANLAVVDYVAVVNEPTAMSAIKAIKPACYVKGPDYSNRKSDLTQKIYEEERAVKQGGGKIVFTDDITFSSSQLINQYLDAFPERTTKYLKKLSGLHNVEEIQSSLNKLSKLKILVIGDTIIDQYHACTALGKSSKENLVANRYISEEDYAGGSLATANHAAQLSDNVDLLTVLGTKNSYEKLVRNRLNPNIKPLFFYRPDRCTTVKRRYVSTDNNRKLFEICFLDDDLLSPDEEKPILKYLEKNIRKYDLVVVSDFGHGMITKKIINLLCTRAKCLAINVQTNSANIGFNLVTKYPRADFVCIDQQELRFATGEKFGEITSLVKKVQKALKAKLVMATRGAQGSLSYSKGGGIEETPSFSQRGVDTIGAGDAFYAYVAPCFATNVPQDLIGFIGNAVGSLKIQIVGNKEPVKKVDLLKFVTRLLKV